MTADDVVRVLDAADAADIALWLDGGWGVDALLGRQHREHDDLDVVVERTDVGAFVAALAPGGYSIAEDHLPTRLVLRGLDGKQVDVHPVAFDDAGTGWQAGAGPDGADCPYPTDGFTTGRVADREVGCLTVAVQIAHHSGYEPCDVDLHDLALLHAAQRGAE